MKIIKDMIRFLACGIILVSVGININNQLTTLRQALRKNKELEVKITQLTEENRVWAEKVKYASSSAYLEGQVRDKLGMGDKDDYWIVLPEKK
jgi:hypothetical protein